MSTYEYTAEDAGTTVAPRVVPRSKGRIVVNWITSTDHKTIGYMYLIASFVFFCLGGVMALVIRADATRRAGAAGAASLTSRKSRSGYPGDRRPSRRSLTCLPARC